MHTYDYAQTIRILFMHVYDCEKTMVYKCLIKPEITVQDALSAELILAIFSCTSCCLHPGPKINTLHLHTHTQMYISNTHHRQIRKQIHSINFDNYIKMHFHDIFIFMLFCLMVYFYGSVIRKNTKVAYIHT